MRTTLRLTALFLVLIALLVPLVAYGSDGPCPDDPELSSECNPTAPPFYVVTNRSFEDLTRAGTGCQPIILNNPDLECCGTPPPELEAEVCPLLADRVTWVSEGQTEIVYEMCCDCSTNPDGEWRFRIRLLSEDGTCPIDPQNEGCFEGLPPGTGIDLPTPVIVGGLAVIGVGLLLAGVMVRRRTLATT